MLINGNPNILIKTNDYGEFWFEFFLLNSTFLVLLFFLIKQAIKCFKNEPGKKYPKVVYQLGSDSKEYIELKKKYDKLIEEFEKIIDWIEEEYNEQGKISIKHYLERARERLRGGG